RLGDRERAREVRAPVADPPAGLGGEHVELPADRLGPNGVQCREDAIAAGGAVGEHLAPPAPERGDARRAAGPPALGGRRPGGVAGSRAQARPPPVVAMRLAACAPEACSSCRQRGSAGRSRWAKIARAAAEAPVIVVTHGIPCRTAAVRISYPSLRAPLPVGV